MTDSCEFGSLYISGKLPTYPSPKPRFCPKWEVSVDVGLGEGKVGSLPETYEDPEFYGSSITLKMCCRKKHSNLDLLNTPLKCSA